MLFIKNHISGSGTAGERVELEAEGTAQEPQRRIGPRVPGRRRLNLSCV